MVPKPVPETGIYGEMLSNSVNEHVVNIGRRGEVPDHQEDRAEKRNPGTQEKITQVTWNGTKRIKTPQNQYTDKVGACVCCDAETVSSDSNYAQKELEKETRQGSLGWTSDTVIVHIDFL